MSSLTYAPRRVPYSPFPARSTPALLALPSEILLHIFALLVGQTPLGPPAALIPVMLSCKALHEHATRPELLARICRFKLDVAAVQRRIISPWNSDLKEHLIYCCRLMRALRRGLPARDAQGNDVPRIQTPLEGERSISMTIRETDVDTDPEEIRDWDPSQVLFACLMMLLDNDGKNIAQLEWAGVYTYVHHFLVERLWDGSYLNDGWPLENDKNASALWAMWLITDQEMLRQETPDKRESLIERIFPFVVLPQRYPSSEAPPNHFHLPLSNASTAHLPQQAPLRFPITSLHAEAYKEPPQFPQSPEDEQEIRRYQPQMYPHYIPSRGFIMPYFGANPFLGAPPSSMAAKLLYVARREVQGIAPPPAPHVPATRATAPPGWRGPTQEDYLTLNAAKGALTPNKARWDWNRGYCRIVDKHQVEGQGPGDGPSKKHDVSIHDGKEKGESDSDDGDDDDKENRRSSRRESDMEDSRKWDTLWWRMRLCNNIYSPKPRFEAGSVYDPGCMRGSWKGKIYIPSGVPFSTLLNRAPIYPGVPDDTGRFSESSIGLIMQPVFLDIQEHHRVCLGASYYRDGERGRSRRTTERGVSTSSQSATDACGTVPIPPPAHRDWKQFSYAEPFLHELGMHSDDEEQEGPDQERGGSRTGQAGSAAAAGSRTGTGATTENADRRSRPHANISASATLDRALEVALAGIPPSAEPVDDQMMHNPLGAQNVPVVDYINPADRETQDNGASIDPSNEANRAVRGHDWQPENRIDHVDMSMTNAWFPGVLGSVKWSEGDGGDVDSRLDALAQGRAVRQRRGNLFVSIGQSPDSNAERGCVHDHGDDLRGKQPESNATQETWVYETYDPERVGSHEYHTSIAPSAGPAHAHIGCRQCSEREAKMKEIREQEAMDRDHREVKEHRRHLERDARRRSRAEAKRKEHNAAISMLDDMMRSFGRQAADVDAHMEDLDTEGGVFGIGEPEDSETEDDGDDESDDQMSVLGDDFDGYDSDVEGRQSDTAHLRAEYYKNLRRGYSPSRIMRPSATNANTSPTTSASPSVSTTTPGASACPSATGDIIVTGGTPESALMWGRRYTVYGRVRPWDGLVGMLRVGQNMLSTDYLFFFGYVVGGRTFVGEWRIASSDVMRPTLGSAIVLSRYD